MGPENGFVGMGMPELFVHERTAPAMESFLVEIEQSTMKDGEL